MQKNSLYSFLFCLTLVLLFSCQREVHFGETVLPQNYLQKDVNGQCQPISANGTYFTGMALADTNFIEVAVVVKVKGPYQISTDTINGYSFQGQGTFSDTGLLRVQLKGNGTPLKPGSDNFTFTLGASTCTAVITVQVPPVGPASFTMQGNPTTCLEANIQGAYIKDIALDYSSIALVQVNVTSLGRFEVGTDTVNGYYFSGAGFFTELGIQSISLRGFGMPRQEGMDVFRIAGNRSSCTFPVRVSSGVETVFNPDYFPLTLGSTWTYTDVWNSRGTFKYTIKRAVRDSVQVNGLVYKMVTEENPVSGPTQHLFRKKDHDYYEYLPIDQYNAAVKFTSVIKRDLLFLKENLSSGAFWESKGDTGTIMGGQPIILKYTFTCLGAGETETIQGKTYTNVVKIAMQPMVRPLDQDYSFAGEITEWHYAKGIGLIYVKNVVTSFTKLHWELTDSVIK